MEKKTRNLFLSIAFFIINVLGACAFIEFASQTWYNTAFFILIMSSFFASLMFIIISCVEYFDL